MLTKQENLLGKGHPGGEQEGKGTQEDCCHVTCSLGFHGDEFSFRVVFNQSF